MKLPLILNYKPRLGVGPSVLLLTGNWIIEAKNLIDSKVNLRLGGPDSLDYHTLFNDKEFTLTEDTPVRIHIIKLGTESNLTIYAIKK